jgi:hypothetical protein
MTDIGTCSSLETGNDMNLIMPPRIQRADRGQRIQDLAHQSPNSKTSCESVTTRIPVMPADWISPLARWRRFPTKAPAKPCRGIGIIGSSDQLFVTGS